MLREYDGDVTIEKVSPSLSIFGASLEPYFVVRNYVYLSLPVRNLVHIQYIKTFKNEVKSRDDTITVIDTYSKNNETRQ